MRKVFLVILSMIFVFSVLCTSISISAATVDKTELEALVATAENLKMENFNAGAINWKIFTMKLEEAKQVLTNPDANQTRVDEVTKGLSDAIARLGREVVQTEAVDKSQLEALIAKANSLKRNDFDIDEGVWNNFQIQIITSENTLNNKKSTQKNIDDAKNNLSLMLEIVEQFRIVNEEEGETEEVVPEFTENRIPNVETNITVQPIIPSESVIVSDVVNSNASQTKPAPETRPKSTTPFLQGGFIEIGCDASIAFSALAVVGIIGSALVIKKKHD